MSGRPARPSPYHVVEGAASDKRILLISHHAPPSNEVGALRWARMARLFAERGWGFDILAADPSSLTNRNDELMGGLPAGTRLFGIPRTRPRLDRFVGGLARGRRWVQESLIGAAPRHDGADTGLAPRRQDGWHRVLNAFHAWREIAEEGAWARAAAEAGRQLFDPAVHRWIVSSGPPHMSHEGGRLLSVWTGLPLVTDFRDAWRFQEWVPLGPAWIRLAARHEARVVRQSTLVVANVEPVRVLMQQAYPDARVITVTNGIDEERVAPAAPAGKFIIGYPGTIYVGRDPTPLFRAMAGLVASHGLSPENIGLEFMGHSGPAVERWLRELAGEHGLEKFLAIHPGAPRPAALEFMSRCAALVAFQQGSDLAVPAKIFEYMQFSAWLLVLAGPKSATAELLRGTHAEVVDPEGTARLQAILAARYEAFRAGERPTALVTQERFSRRHQAGRLLDAIEALQPLDSTG